MSDIDFGLSPDEYWTDPQRTNLQVAQQLWALAKDVTVVGVPPAVVLELRTTLPAVIYRGGSYRDLWALSFQEHAFVTALNLESNQLHVGHLTTEEVEAPDPPLNPAEAPAGDSTDSAVVDLREALRLPWEPSRYLVTVILRDHLSNRAMVHLAHKEGAYQDPEVERHQAEQRAALEPNAIVPTPGRPLPSFDKQPKSPPIPSQFGIAMTVERVIVAREGARAVLYGSFRLPVLPREMVRNPEQLAGASAADPPSAVLKVTLLATGSEKAGPAVVPVALPSWDQIDPARPVATGHFAFDLFDLGLLSAKRRQTNFIYAFSGEILEGPLPTALVAEGRSP